jgi:hypothetical protein
MRLWVALFALLLAGTITTSVRAQSRVADLAKQLRTADDFRVRTQAALALGASGDVAAVAPLCDGLKDKIPAVRAGAAAGLGKLGKKEGAACLKTARAAEKDGSVAAQIDQSIAKIQGGGSDAPPPIGADAKYYVAIEVQSKSSKPLPEVEKLVRGAIQSKLLSAGGFAIAPKAETPAQAGQIVKAKKLAGFFLIATVEAPVYSGGNLMQKMTVTIWNYPDKALKGQVAPKMTQQGTPSADPASESELIKLCSESATNSFVKIIGTLQ